MLVDLWAGTSGALFALLSLGVRVYCIAAEMDDEVARFTERNFSQVVRVKYVEEISADMLDGFMQKREVKAILIGGGSPCQGNTPLTRRRRGLDDPRTLQPVQLARIRDEVRGRFPSALVLTYLENVASMPMPVEKEYNEIMGSNAILCDAGDFGWVTRRRLFWGSGPPGLLYLFG